MDAQLKAKWVAALRSGKYRKGIGQLKQRVITAASARTTYCCLGVLCRIEPEAAKSTKGGTFIDDRTAKQLGFTLGGPRAQLALSRLNDDFGKSFKQIADYIEENF